MTRNASLLIETCREGQKGTVFISDARFQHLPDNSYRISFPEMETSDPTPDTVFTLSADATSLTVRTGSPRYIGTGGDIELRSGTRQQMHYNSESPMTVGVFTGPVCSTLTENGGAVEVRFTLDFNSAYAMTNTLKVSVKRKTGNKKRTERK